MAYNPLDDLTNMPGAAGDVAREQLAEPSMPLETPQETSARYAAADKTQQKIERTSAADLAARGVPTYRDESGSVTPVTDAAGNPLSYFDEAHNVAWDSSGKPVSLSYGAEGAPKLGDPYESAPVTTDKKTGDQYKAPAGLPWQWVGQDQAIADQAAAAEKTKALKEASAAMGGKISADHAQYITSSVDWKNQQKALTGAVPSFGMKMPEDLPGAKKAIDDYFNGQLQQPEANAKTWMGFGSTTDDAQALRQRIEQQRQQAHAAAESAFAAKSKMDSMKANLDQERALQDQLANQRVQSAMKSAAPYILGTDGSIQFNEQKPFDGMQKAIQDGHYQARPGDLDQARQDQNRQTAISEAQAGNKPYQVDQTGAVSLPPQNRYDAMQAAARDGIIPQPSQKDLSDAYNVQQQSQAVSAAKAGQKTYKLDDTGNILFNPSNPAPSLNEAVKDGLITQDKANELYPKLNEMVQKQKEVQDLVNAHPELSKALAVAHGATSAGAFWAGGAGTVSAMSGVNTAIGGLQPELAWATVPLASAVEFLAGGTIATALKDKLEQKLGEYSQSVKDFSSSAAAHPMYDAAGNILALAIGGGATSLPKLARAAGIASEEAGPMAAAKLVASRVATSAAGGAVFEGAIRPAFDAARYAAADAMGIPHDKFQGPTAASIATNAGLAALMAGHGIGFKEYNENDLAQIMQKGLGAAQQGRPLESVLTQSEIEAFDHVNGELAKVAATGQQFVSDPTSFKMKVKQAILAPDRPIGDKAMRNYLDKQEAKWTPDQRAVVESVRRYQAQNPTAPIQDAYQAAFEQTADDLGKTPEEVQAIYGTATKPPRISVTAGTAEFQHTLSNGPGTPGAAPTPSGWPGPTEEPQMKQAKARVVTPEEKAPEQPGSVSPTTGTRFGKPVGELPAQTAEVTDRGTLPEPKPGEQYVARGTEPRQVFVDHGPDAEVRYTPTGHVLDQTGKAIEAPTETQAHPDFISPEKAASVTSEPPPAEPVAPPAPISVSQQYSPKPQEQAGTQSEGVGRNSSASPTGHLEGHPDIKTFQKQDAEGKTRTYLVNHPDVRFDAKPPFPGVELHQFTDEKTGKATIGIKGELTPKILNDRIAASREKYGVPHGETEHGPQAPVDQAAHEAATSPRNELPEPTMAQKEAGNTKMGHVRVGGLPITVENPEGSIRSNVDIVKLRELAQSQIRSRRIEKIRKAVQAYDSGDAEQFQSRARDAGYKDAFANKMTGHYGYIKGTTGADGDHVDVFVKPGTPEDWTGPVFAVSQNKPDGTFDEHKAIVGVQSEQEAKDLYHSNYSKDWKGFAGIQKFDNPEAFKDWLKSHEQPEATQELPPPVHPRPEQAARTGTAPSTGPAGREPAQDSGGAGVATGRSGSGGQDLGRINKAIDEAFTPHAKSLDDISVAISREPTHKGNRSGFEYENKRVKVDVDKLSKTLADIAEHGGDQDAYVKHAADEEVSHAQFLASEVSRQTAEEIAKNLTSDQRSAISSLRSGKMSDFQMGAEWLRMVDQAQRLGNITEAFISTKRAEIAKAVLPLLLAPQPQIVQEALAAMHVIRTGRPIEPTAQAPKQTKPKPAPAPKRKPVPPQERSAPPPDLDQAIRDAFEGLESEGSDLDGLHKRIEANRKRIAELSDKIKAFQGQNEKESERIRARAAAFKEQQNALSKKLKGESEPLNAQGTMAQVPLPKTHRATFMDLADKLMESGIKTPEALGSVLDRAVGERAHKYSQAVWDVMAATGDVARGTHDWDAIYGGLKPQEAKPQRKEEDFAKSVKIAATEVPKEKLFGPKAFIHHIWQEWNKQPGNDMSLQDFQRSLMVEIRKGSLGFSRADFPDAHSGEDLRDSLMKYGQEEYNFMMVPGMGGEPPLQKPIVELSNKLQSKLANGETITPWLLFKTADETFQGTRGSGAYTPKDAYDALERGVNLYIEKSGLVKFNDPQGTVERLTDLLERLPTQTNRTEEQNEFQQFSTPPPLAFAVSYLANVKAGDAVMEPSAGLGGIAIFAKMAGGKVYVNELSDRRRDMLEGMGFYRITGEDAEHLNALLPKHIKPSVVVMNPPFSASAGKREGERNTMTGAQHVEQALQRLEPGGRLVAIVGQGMAADRPAFRDWWKRIGSQYDVRANVGVSGEGYRKYGTSFDNQVLVIDKNPPAGTPITGNVDSVAQLLEKLDTLHANERTAGTSGARSNLPESGQPNDSGNAGTGNGGGSETAGAPATGQMGTGAGDVLQEPGKSGAAPEPARAIAGKRPANGPGPKPATPGNRKQQRPGTGGSPAARGTEPSAVGSGNPVPAASVTLPSGEIAEVGKAGANENTADTGDDIFASYHPQKISVPDAKPHPTPLVESAAMRSVSPPDTSYQPKLSKKMLERGMPSLPQYEAIVYAGHAHSQVLPDGQRKGYMVGDGTGVGKTIELLGIYADNAAQGRTRAIWLSEKPDLIKGIRNDAGAMGIDDLTVGNLADTKSKSGTIQQPHGILYATYNTMSKDLGANSIPPEFRKGATVRLLNPSTEADSKKEFVVERVRQTSKGIEVIAKSASGEEIKDLSSKLASVKPVASDTKTRIDQLVEWAGKDFDGLVIFDEAHNAANAIGKSGPMGDTDASKTGRAVLELQERLPNARVVYASATGATEVENLAFAERLGIWGKGTPFPTKAEFFDRIAATGVSAMEIVARDLKAMGAYISRTLSFGPTNPDNPEDKGVEVSTLEHALSPEQTKVYDDIAKAWQIVYSDIESVLESTGGSKNSRAKAMARGAFYSSQQRFFNQVLTAMQMPSVITDMERNLKEGRSILAQITNTNEAILDRALVAANESETPLEELDLSPKDMLRQYLEKSFPTAKFERLIDENGKEYSKPLVDSAGNPVQDPDAVAKRDALLDRVARLPVPESPLEQILDHFGADNVAEITGRNKRVVYKDVDGKRKRVVEVHGPAQRRIEAQQFNDGKRRILIFSDAGGTGFSYHAGLNMKNQEQRAHYLLQAGWRADKAIQGLGRGHRSNQRIPPKLILVRTNLEGHKRFISTIARRLAQLGALTSGERRTAGKGMFSDMDNLENSYSAMALQMMLTDAVNGKIEGIGINDLEQKLGLKGLVNESGKINPGAVEAVKIETFLNRILAIEVADQNKIFGEFFKRMEALITRAKETDTYDDGLQTLRPPRGGYVKKLSSVDTERFPGLDEPTRIVEIERAEPAYLRPFDQATERMTNPQFVRNKRSGKVYAVEKTNLTRTEKATGNLIPVVRKVGVRTEETPYSTEIDTSAGPDHVKVGDVIKDEKGQDVTVASLPDPKNYYSRLMVQREGASRPAPYASYGSSGYIDATVLYKSSKKVVPGFEKELGVNPEAGNYEALSQDEARKAWNEEIASADPLQRSRKTFLVGVMLPIWHRLGNMTIRAFKVTTSEGESMLGVQIPPKYVNEVKRALGVGGTKYSPDEVFRNVLDNGEEYKLASDSGLRIMRRRVGGEPRIEIDAPQISDSLGNELRSMGAFSEMVGGFKRRFFVPTEDQTGQQVLTSLLKKYPVIGTGESESLDAEGYHDGSPFAEHAGENYDQLDRADVRKWLDDASPERRAWAQRYLEQPELDPKASRELWQKDVYGEWSRDQIKRLPLDEFRAPHQIVAAAISEPERQRLEELEDIDQQHELTAGQASEQRAIVRAIKARLLSAYDTGENLVEQDWHGEPLDAQGFDAFLEDDLKPVVAEAKQGVGEILKWIPAVLSPASLADPAAVDALHRYKGEQDKKAWILEQTLKSVERGFSMMSQADQVAFVDRFKRGVAQPTNFLRDVADTLSKIDTETWHEAHDAYVDLGYHPNDVPLAWLDNHFRVLWKTIPGKGMTQKNVGMMSRRPLSGSKGMQKHHTLDDMSQGLAAGGVPYSYNPVTMFRRAQADLRKLVSALRMFKWMKDHKFAVWVPGKFGKRPEGFEEVDDPLFRRYFPTPQGIVEPGRYFIEENMARLLRNWLSRDLVRETAVGRGLMWLKNVTTAAELGLSPFHLVFESIEAMSSSVGLALQKIFNRGFLHGDARAIIDGIKDIVTAPVAPIGTARTGGNAMRFATVAGWSATPSGQKFLKQFPNAKELIDAAFTGGAKLDEPEWKVGTFKTMVENIADHNWIGATLRIVPGINEMLMNPLFETYIPRLKLGMFLREFSEALLANQSRIASGVITKETLARQTWSFIEDRFGEMNFDNLFWNRTFKAGAQLLTRSVTWKLGDVRAFGGAFTGQAVEFRNAVREGRAPMLNRNMAWMLGLAIVTATMAAVIGYGFTKRWPKSIKDLVYPQIDPADEHIRLSLPTYFKDAFSITHNPKEFLLSSMSGWINRLTDLWRNKDFYGTKLYNEDDPAGTKLKDAATSTVQNLVPFSLRNYAKMNDEHITGLRKWMAMGGFGAAPKWITNSPAEQKASDLLRAKSETVEGRTKEQAQHSKEVRDLATSLRRGEVPRVGPHVNAEDFKNASKRASMGQLEYEVSRLGAEDALKVMQVANPKEKEKLAPIVAQKVARAKPETKARINPRLFQGF